MVVKKTAKKTVKKAAKKFPPNPRGRPPGTAKPPKAKKAAKKTVKKAGASTTTLSQLIKNNGSPEDARLEVVIQGVTYWFPLRQHSVAMAIEAAAHALNVEAFDDWVRRYFHFGKVPLTVFKSSTGNDMIRLVENGVFLPK